MNTDNFFSGLMKALDSYARDCGVDQELIATGGRVYSKDWTKQDYTYVRNKAVFRGRVEQLLANFLEEAQKVKDETPASVPVLNDPWAKEKNEEAYKKAAEWLANFRWGDLRNNDYKVARRAWYYLDGLKVLCSLHPDLTDAFLDGAKKAGITMSDDGIQVCE